MVTQRSATSTGLTAAVNEDNIPLNTDHRGLVKYDDRNQEEYHIVKGRLRTLIAEAKSKAANRAHGSSWRISELWMSCMKPDLN